MDVELEDAIRNTRNGFVTCWGAGLEITWKSRGIHAESEFSTKPKWFAFALKNALLNLARESRVNHAEREFAADMRPCLGVTPSSSCIYSSKI